MKNIITLALLLSISFSGFSQDKSSCITSEVHNALLENNSAYRIDFEQNQATTALASDTGQVFTIPIVFHIIHLGENIGSGSNIPDAKVLEAMQRLNDDFEFANDLGLDIGIRFCLAKVDPNGQPTTGITRFDGSNIPNYANSGIGSGLTAGLNELIIKEETGWPNTRYYNVWVVHDILSGAGGYAYYPTTTSLDGTVILDYLVDDNYDTFVHELGHAFDLRHTFEGDLDNLICPGNGNCSNQGDLICDTPPHKKWDCGFSNPCTSAGNWTYSADNLMSYCPNGTLITPDQKTRMRNAANKFPRIRLNTSSNYVCSDVITLDAELTSINNPLENIVINQCGNSISASFTVTNLGNVPIQQFSVDYTYDGILNSQSYNTYIIPGYSKDFVLPEYYFTNSSTSGQHQLTIEILNVNETLDDNLSNNLQDVDFELLDTCTITGIENSYLSQIKIFPSPNTDGTLKFRNLSNQFNTNVSIIDASGRLLKKSSIHQNDYDLDISNLSKGVYFVTIEMDGFTECRKLLIQ